MSKTNTGCCGTAATAERTENTSTCCAPVSDPATTPAGTTAESAPAGPHGYAPHKEAHLKRLRRIEGQVRGVARMVEEDKYCIDILTQVAAISKALHAVSLNLLEEHIGHCVTGAAIESERTGDPAIVEAKVKEATAAVSRLMRS